MMTRQEASTVRVLQRMERGFSRGPTTHYVCGSQLQANPSVQLCAKKVRSSVRCLQAMRRAFCHGQIEARLPCGTLRRVGASVRSCSKTLQLTKRYSAKTRKLYCPGPTIACGYGNPLQEKRSLLP